MVVGVLAGVCGREPTVFLRPLCESEGLTVGREAEMEVGELEKEGPGLSQCDSHTSPEQPQLQMCA